MNVFLQVIQCSPLSSEIPFPYILSSLFFLADPSAVYSNLIHFCPARYSSTSNRLGNWSHTTCRFVYAEKRVGAYTDTWLFYLKILLMGKIAPRHGLVRNLHLLTTVHLFLPVPKPVPKTLFLKFSEKNGWGDEPSKIRIWIWSEASSQGGRGGIVWIYSHVFDFLKGHKIPFWNQKYWSGLSLKKALAYTCSDTCSGRVYNYTMEIKRTWDS